MFQLRLSLAIVALAAPGVLLAVDRVAPARPDAAGAAVKRGVDRWQAQDYDAAVAAWRPVAEAGDADAQFNLAQAYKLGRGVPVDLRQAEAWYRKAAVQGHEQAQATLGLIMFQNGDRAGAMPWLEKAADRGEPRAQYVYGTALFNGDNAPKDWPRAYALMTRAAAAGLPQAKSSLAQMDQFVPMAQRQQGTAMAAARTAAAPPPRVATTNATQPMPAAAPRVAAAAPAPKPAAPKPVVTAQAVQKPVVPKPIAQKPVATATSAPKPKPTPSKAAVSPPPQVAQAGGWRIQLGAFGTAGAAQSAWSAAGGRAPALRRLQPFYVKAGAVTRLQAGPFASRAAANEACRAAGSTCFPVNP